MSLFQRRAGRSIFEAFNKTGIKKIVKMIKLEKKNDRYKNSDRFKPVIESSPSLAGAQERESNKMYGTFDLERAV